MNLNELPNCTWNSYEKDRFLKDSPKTKTASFDPESFKHDGFDNLEKYRQKYVPALAEPERVVTELNNFTPPRLSSINDSPYQALVIRYGILRILIEQQDYSMAKDELLEAVQAWQQDLVDRYSEENFGDTDDLLHLAKAAVDYGSDVYDTELNMVHSYFELRNRSLDRKQEYYTWLDFFKRLSSIDRFPKVSRSEKPAHAIDTIEKGLWSLQEQALVYEIKNSETGQTIAGFPSDYVDTVADWLHFEMSDENYLTMLETLPPFNRQDILVEARDKFGVHTGTQGRNDKRRESLVLAGVYPSELLRECCTKEELKNIVDEFGIDAHKQKTDEMVHGIIKYFEQSQKVVEAGEPAVEAYLACYEAIADGQIECVPPQLQQAIDEQNPSRKMDILFEEATAEIFSEIFNLHGVNLLGQGAQGSVADGEIEQDGKWLLWDNKRRSSPFKLGASTRAKIKSYVDMKNEQHDVKWFLIIAPEFAESSVENALELEMEIGIDVRLVESGEFRRLAENWRENFGENGYELPLSIFKGSDLFEVDPALSVLKKQFA